MLSVMLRVHLEEIVGKDYETDAAEPYEGAEAPRRYAGTGGTQPDHTISVGCGVWGVGFGV